MRTRSLIGALALGVLAQSSGAQDAANGRELFAVFCSACHGYGARGDG